MKVLHMMAFLLLVVGGLNWLLWGAFDYNLVDSLLTAGSMAAKVVYILVGLSAIYLLLTHKAACKACSKTM